MLCPYCGTEFGDETPKKATGGELDDCPSCTQTVYSLSNTKNTERTRHETIAEGSSFEEFAADLYVEKTGIAEDHCDNGKVADIDRILYDTSPDNPVAYLEIKERNVTLNAYQITKFPYAKIESAVELKEKEDVPVYVLIKFLDTWAIHAVGQETDYVEGNKPFTPNYRGQESETEHQYPVLLPVSDFAVLPWEEDCLTAEDLSD